MNDQSLAKEEYYGDSDSLSEALKSIQEMLHSAAGSRPLFPPTQLYNEGWLLRLVLNWFSEGSVQDHPLSFAAGAKWFSEALLPSAFLARYRGDKLAESWTHADGVVGHFLVGSGGKADLSLKPEANQLLVLEAKMFSSLSSGVTNASYYDQAARNVACMAEVLHRAECHPSELATLRFSVLAPSSQIKKGVFSKLLQKESILSKVTRRAEDYEGDKERWFEEWFRPTLEHAAIDCMSWEELIATVQERDLPTGKSLKQFYEHCLSFNR